MCARALDRQDAREAPRSPAVDHPVEHLRFAWRSATVMSYLSAANAPANGSVTLEDASPSRSRSAATLARSAWRLDGLNSTKSARALREIASSPSAGSREEVEYARPAGRRPGGRASERTARRSAARGIRGRHQVSARELSSHDFNARYSPCHRPYSYRTYIRHPHHDGHECHLVRGNGNGGEACFASACSIPSAWWSVVELSRASSIPSSESSSIGTFMISRRRR